MNHPVPKNSSAYATLLADGTYEYGIVEYCHEDRRKDKTVSKGTHPDLDEALKLAETHVH